ncbi:MAG: glycosyltransferase family 39 protein [Isosphaeraceae bacterium]|nr:glycosyltransferase family 39 protein [Isosphaeraceae bacterium]
MAGLDASTAPASDRAGASWRDGTIALVLATAATTLLLATGPDFGMVWDEGYTVRRERLLDDWFRLVATPLQRGGGWAAFEKSRLDHNWPFSREEPDGHPPFYALLGLAGWRASRRWLPPLEAYRLGPMVLTGLTVGVLYLHLARRRGRLAGFLGAAFFLLMPRVFAHAHYAHYDMPMTCLWLIAQCAFVASLQSRWWAVACGVALGLSAGTKFTGLFAAAPPIAWVTCYELLPFVIRRGAKARGNDRAGWPGLKALAIGLPIAALTLYAIQPAWWQAPVSGLHRFLVSNLTRAKTQPVPTLYLGKVYEFALPWHNTLVLTAVTTPLVILALGTIGLAVCMTRRREDRWALIWPLSWATLMIVRALPNAPGHDGIRLFLPSVASLAVLAGLGACWLAERFPRPWATVVALLLPAAAAGECLVGMARTYPYTDSYYNAAIGGLPGAERLGFELTYYWETTGPEFLDWVRAQARRGPVELCFTMDAVNHKLLREWGDIPPAVKILDLNVLDRDAVTPTRPDYVLQRRESLYYPRHWWLERHGHPRFVIRREGVDLLRVFPSEEFVESVRQTAHEPVPHYLYSRR